MKAKINPILLLVLLASAGAYFILGYKTDRANFVLVISLYGLVFLGYLYLVRQPLTLVQSLVIALLFRLIFIGATPRLSDDYFRFIWDGTLVSHGHNPFQHPPNYYVIPHNKNLVPALTQELYTNLNSPAYYSLYPPVCQAVFGLAYFWGGNNIWLNCLIMRFFILLAEMGSFFFLIRLLQRLQLPIARLGWYAFNPLIILELKANLHPEGLLLCFLLGSIYFILKNKTTESAVGMALAVGVKLWPLMFLPLIFRKISFRAFLRYSIWLSSVLIILFLPFISVDLALNIFKSLNLYFRQFEFNASLYYLVRWVGYRGWGYNMIGVIGPFLSVITMAGILYLAFRPKKLTDQIFLQVLLFSFTIYLALATVVHPWYLASLVALCTLTRWRYPIIWSGLVYLSYATYQTSAYTENLFLVALEYLGVFGFMAYEWSIYRRNLFTTAPTEQE